MARSLFSRYRPMYTVLHWLHTHTTIVPSQLITNMSTTHGTSVWPTLCDPTLIYIAAEMVRLYPSQTCPPSCSICNHSSPRSTWEPFNPQIPPASQPRVTYRYLFTIEPHCHVKRSLKVACRTSQNRRIQYHPYRPHDRTYPAIIKIDKDMFLMAERMRRQLQADETLLCRLFGPQDRIEGKSIYRLPSADTSSEIMGPATPVPALMNGWDDDEDEISADEQKIMSWLSRSETDVFSTPATPGVDNGDSLGMGHVVTMSPESSRIKLIFIPNRTLDYPKPPLSPVPTTPYRTSNAPRTPTPHTPKSSKRSASPSPLTLPPRKIRPSAPQLPYLPSFPTQYSREHRQPPSISSSVSTRHHTAHDIGTGPLPFALIISPSQTSSPKCLLPALEIESPRTYHLNRLAEANIPSPTLISSPRLTSIDSDLSAALDRLMTDCGEGSDPDSALESMTYSFPLPATRTYTITPISAKSSVLATPHVQARSLLPPSPGPGQGRTRMGGEITIGRHDFLMSLSNPTPSERFEG